MAELYIIGPAEIRNTEGQLEHSFLAGPKRLALLVYLLMNRPRGFHRRDSLLPLFWPEHGQKSARNALSNMLYHIRKTLGSDVIINRGSEELNIQPEAFWSDIHAFEEYIEKGELENALELYRAELLKGFYIPDASSEFDQWLDEERERLQKLATNCAWTIADNAEKSQDLETAKKWARKAATINPLCEQTMSRYITLLERTGDRKEALDTYQQYTKRLQSEYEEEPPEELEALVENIRSNSHASYPVANQNQNSKKTTTPQEVVKESIAVLPFETLGKERATAFTDAIHGDILTRLSNVGGLRVTSRTSVMNFRNPNRLLPKVAQELGVEWVLEGEVQETSNRIQVNVRLANAVQDCQVWAANYQKELTADNLFQIQAEITKHITEELKTRLAKKEKFAIKEKPTNDLEAYCLQAQGRWSLDQRTEQGMRKAIACFRESIKRDPNYTLAWVGLADTLILSYEYGYVTEEEVLPEANEIILELLNSNSDLAEVNTTAALYHESRREVTIAIEKFKKAIEQRPNYADAHNWLSWTSQLVGKKEEALSSAEIAVELNPLSPEAISNLSLSLLINGDYKQAQHEARRIQQIQPEWTSGYFLEGVALYYEGEFKKALALLKDLSVPWTGNGPEALTALAYLKVGEKAKANKLKEQLADARDYFSVALVHAACQETEACFQYLQKEDSWNYWAVISIHSLYPEILDPIRQDNRFESIMHQVRLTWK